MVATKKFGNAVQRNRARRLIREAMRRLCHLIRPEVDLVIIVRSRMLGATFDQVHSALQDILKRAGLFTGPPAEDLSVDGPQF